MMKDGLTGEKSPITERHVQVLWYDGRLRPKCIRTTEGLPVHVVDPGRWNVEAGPDFLDAVLEIGSIRRRIVGDVEIHLHPADWRLHGHADNPAYARVIAHVTWHAAPCRPDDRLPEGCICICLGEFLRTRSDFSPDEIDISAYPYAHLPATPRPCERLFSNAPDRLCSFLRAAGIQRLEAKARRFTTAFIRTRDHGQVFYSETFSALGYKQNSAPFRQIAARVPWRELPASRESAFASLSCVADMTVARTRRWKRANVRPANTPEKRLAAAAALFAGTYPSLLDRLRCCDLATRIGQETCCDIIGESKLIGRRRAAAILANVIIPFAFAEGWLAVLPDWIVPEETNATVRLTAFRLLGRDHNPAIYAGNGVLLQGLLQVHHVLCLSARSDCEKCHLLTQAPLRKET